MSATDVMRVRLARLLHEIGLDRAAFDKKLDELASYRRELDVPSPGRPVLAPVALDLHDAYTALEVLFERVARAIDGRLAEAVRQASAAGGRRVAAVVTASRPRGRLAPMVPDSPPTNDPLAELARELGAPPPAGLAVLDAERLRELLATLRAARAHEAEALAAATEAALGHVPWVLRGLVRKALGDEPR